METIDIHYSQELYERMVEKYPILSTKTIQNILDQRRSLFVNDRLTPETINQIRQEVAVTLGIATETPAQDNAETQDLQQSRNVVSAEITNYFETNIILYTGTNPMTRPALPKLHFSSNTNNIISQINRILEEKVEACRTLDQLHELIYIAAATTLNAHQQTTQDKESSERRIMEKPWERRLKNQIESARKDIAVLELAVKDRACSRRVKKKTHIIVEKQKNQDSGTEIEVLDHLKQILAVKSNRLRRYREAATRRSQNALFYRNQKAFYRALQTQTHNNQPPEQPPDPKPTLEYWKNIWADTTQHQTNARWIADEKKRTARIPYMIDNNITAEEIKNQLRKTQNWKAAGIDNIHNFWLKRFHSTHLKLANIYNEIMQNPELAPAFLTQGRTYLLPKTDPPSSDPSKYRPITCLPTIYKVFTGIIAEKIQGHLEQHNILAEEQKGCRKRSQGCKEQIIIDSIITEQTKKKKGDLYWAYIDYRKAFDSVPHSWLEEVLKIYKIDPQIRELLAVLMKRWETELRLNNRNLGRIAINRGIYQGDSLSALWFCLALNPLSSLLNKRKIGYSLNNLKINHIAYMDDIKILCNTNDDLTQLISQIQRYSKDIKMEFGFDKCRTNSTIRGVWRHHEGYELNAETEGRITGMDRGEAYKYLGVLQTSGIEHGQMKEMLTETYKKRLRKLLKSKLSAVNMMKAVNTYAAPILSYSFGLLKWTQTDLENLNRTTRTEFTKQRAHHPRSSVERFHLPREKGGRGIVDFRRLHQKIVQGMRDYFLTKAETSSTYRSISDADQGYTPLNLANRGFTPAAGPSVDQELEKWAEKPLHGRYKNTVTQPFIDTKASHQWLLSTNLFPETEGFMMSIQDQVIATLNYRKHIIKDPAVTEDRCRMCGKEAENIEHLISACSIMAPKEYTERHNNVAKIIHHYLRNMIYETNDQTPYYRYNPEKVIENMSGKLYWDRTIMTDHQINNNRPDITYIDKVNKHGYIIDIAVPAPANIQLKQREKITKYMPLANEIKELWRLEQVEIVPIIIGATGEIPTELHQYLQKLKLPPKTYIHLQKATILATCSLVRKVLNIK